MTQLEVVHTLPCRLRLKFSPPLELHQAFGIQASLVEIYPYLPLRLWGLGQGLVIGDGNKPIDPNLIAEIAQLLIKPIDHIASWRDRLIHLLMILAILGWALPVLPGTPFFLLALALRYKPK